MKTPATLTKLERKQIAEIVDAAHKQQEQRFDLLLSKCGELKKEGE